MFAAIEINSNAEKTKAQVIIAEDNAERKKLGIELTIFNVDRRILQKLRLVELY